MSTIVKKFSRKLDFQQSRDIEIIFRLANETIHQKLICKENIFLQIQKKKCIQSVKLLPHSCIFKLRHF
jgi:hypothetical protein